MCLSAGLLSACVGGMAKDGGEEETQPTLREAVSGIIVLYQPEADTSDDLFIDGFAGGEKRFSVLADRQISMLADDILLRLNAVYGTGMESQASAVLTDKDNNAVVKTLSSSATYYKKDTISTFGSGYKLLDGTAASATLNLTDAGSIAYNLYGAAGDGAGVLNYDATAANTALAKNFQFINAIAGGSASRTAEGVLSFSTSGANTWNWSNQSLYAKTVSTNIVAGDYKSYLRMALSDILANGYDYSSEKEYTDYTFDQTRYDENLKKIDHLGLGTADAEVIKKFIKHSIIGQSIVDADNLAIEKLAAKTSIEAFNYDIQSGFVAEMEAAALAELNSLNNIRFYDVVINGMVDSLVANTFAGETVLVYPQMPRLKTQYIDYDLMDNEKNPYWTREGMDVKNVIIMPRKECRLDVITFCFQQKVDLNTTYYATTNVNYVVNGVSYSGTVEATINPGEIPPHNDEEHEVDNNTTGGSYKPGGDPPAAPETDPLMENETGVELIDIYQGYLPDGKTLADLTANEWKAFIWKPFSGSLNAEFSTVMNPFTLHQTLLDEGGRISSSTASFFDAGTNYLELSFQFFTKDDNDLLVPCTSMYPYGFRISNEWSTVSFGEDMYKDPNERPDQPTEFD